MTDKVYSEVEAGLLADRATMKAKMDEMAHRIESTERATKDGFSDIKVQITALSTAVEKQLSAEEMRREAHKVELSKEYATKMEVERLSHKVETMWVKITATITAVIGVGMVMQYLLFTSEKVRTLLGH